MNIKYVQYGAMQTRAISLQLRRYESIQMTQLLRGQVQTLKLAF